MGGVKGTPVTGGLSPGSPSPESGPTRGPLFKHLGGLSQDTFYLWSLSLGCWLTTRLNGLDPEGRRARSRVPPLEVLTRASLSNFHLVFQPYSDLWSLQSVPQYQTAPSHNLNSPHCYRHIFPFPWHLKQLGRGQGLRLHRPFHPQCQPCFRMCPWERVSPDTDFCGPKSREIVVLTILSPVSLLSWPSPGTANTKLQFLENSMQFPKTT